MQHDISFVVPALNEEGTIEGMLDSAREACSGRLTYEVVVVDNGSRDRTRDSAAAKGARVLHLPEASLGRLRNVGAKSANGEVLVFLDADIRLTASWATAIPSTVQQVRADPRLVVGSWGLPPADAGWIATAWMDTRVRRRALSHLGTGHMIIGRSPFLKLGGFNESLSTGEDFEFCRRAVSAGFRIKERRELEVVHTRMPSTAWQFFRREVWHGQGDAGSWRRVVRSPVALTAIGFGLLHLVLLLGVTLGPAHARPIVAGGGIVAIAALLLWGAVRRGGVSRPFHLAARAALVYLYLWGRVVALVINAFHRTRGWHRSR